MHIQSFQNINNLFRDSVHIVKLIWHTNELVTFPKDWVMIDAKSKEVRQQLIYAEMNQELHPERICVIKNWDAPIKDQQDDIISWLTSDRNSLNCLIILPYLSNPLDRRLLKNFTCAWSIPDLIIESRSDSLRDLVINEFKKSHQKNDLLSIRHSSHMMREAFLREMCGDYHEKTLLKSIKNTLDMLIKLDITPLETSLTLRRYLWVFFEYLRSKKK